MALVMLPNGSFADTDDVIPPQNSPIPPIKSVGPFTGGTSTENAAPAGGGFSPLDPRSWFRADPNQTFKPGEPIPGASGPAFSALFGGGNPAWRGAIAAGGVLSPTPAETGQLPLQTLGRSPSGPMAPTPSGIGSDANRPVMGAGGFPTTYAAPGQQPAAPGPMALPPLPPVRPSRKRINPKSVNLGTGMPAAATSPFVQVDRPNASASGGARGNGGPLQMSALDLSKIFQHPAVQAAMGAR